MSACCPPSRAEGGDWLLVRIDPAIAAESHYMAGYWITEQRFGKRIRGYGNALAVLDRAPKEAGCTYEIRPVPSPVIEDAAARQRRQRRERRHALMGAGAGPSDPKFTSL
jgi:hypothetical protein